MRVFHVVLNNNLLYLNRRMTLITFSDGKVVMKGDAVGTEQACCCNECDSDDDCCVNEYVYLMVCATPDPAPGWEGNAQAECEAAGGFYYTGIDGTFRCPELFVEAAFCAFSPQYGTAIVGPCDSLEPLPGYTIAVSSTNEGYCCNGTCQADECENPLP